LWGKRKWSSRGRHIEIFTHHNYSHLAYQHVGWRRRYGYRKRWIY
jgi:hypothetical protein